MYVLYVGRLGILRIHSINIPSGLTPQMKITHCLIIYKSKNKYPGHNSGNTAAFHSVV